LEAVQLDKNWFCFAKTIMYLANFHELRIRIDQTWEIALNGIAWARFGGGCAAELHGTMRVFVGEPSQNAAKRSLPGECSGGTKWVARPTVGRSGAKEVGVGR
jgi:hypothetical protein